VCASHEYGACVAGPFGAVGEYERPGYCDADAQGNEVSEDEVRWVCESRHADEG
jgi:hypothetical protein